MQLTLHIEDKSKTLEIPENILVEAEDFFQKMDQDMDKGWQMSRQWVENPSKEQRCQIAADKLLSALNAENETLLMLMAGYILARMPAIKAVRIDVNGEMAETELLTV